MSTLESLPDEILQKLFSFLSILDRLKFERVCKRWSRVMPYQIQEIDFVQALIPSRRLKNADTFPSTPSSTALLKRCGRFLHKISFGKSNLLIPFTMVQKIDELCPNLESLDLSFCTVTEQIASALMNFGDRLLSIDLSNTIFSIRYPNQHVDNMSILFAGMRRLEKINLQRTNVHNLLAVSHLPESLKCLNLNACSPLLPSTLFEILIKCYDLEELRLSAYSRINSAIIEAVCTLPKLKILDISRQSGEFSTSSNQNDDNVDWRKLKQLPSLRVCEKCLSP